MMMKELRPWGSYEILLDSDACKVKRITVSPGEKLSYQYHYKRSEVWTFVSGAGILTLEDEDMPVCEGSVVQIAKEQKHRVYNDGPFDLVFVEVQLGSYFGEDDIVRLEDSYGRV